MEENISFEKYGFAAGNVKNDFAKRKILLEKQIKILNEASRLRKYILKHIKDPEEKARFTAKLITEIYPRDYIVGLMKLLTENRPFKKASKWGKEAKKLGIAIKFETINNKEYVTVSCPADLTRKDITKALSYVSNYRAVITSIRGDRKKEYKRRSGKRMQNKTTRDGKIRADYKKMFKEKPKGKRKKSIEIQYMLAQKYGLSFDTIRNIIYKK